MAKKLLFIIGSHRKNSFNMQLANEIIAMIGARAECSILDYTNVPMLNQDDEYPAPDAAKVAAAGNDLFMPGSRKELSEILKGLKNGTVKPKDLLINASRIKRVHDDMMRW